MGPRSAINDIPDDVIHGGDWVEYGKDEKPAVLEHYWLEGKPTLLAPNIVRVGYSVAKPDGKLVAYRWSEEQTVRSENYVWCDRVTDPST